MPRPKHVVIGHSDTNSTSTEIMHVNWRAPDFNVSVQVTNASGGDFTLQKTNYQPADGEDFSAAAWANVDTLAAASTVYDIITPCTALKGVVGATAVDAITLDIVQNG